jgi:aminobenzoyl-glutamate utilization protein A
MNYRDSLKGKIKLIFQPAEEGVRGAKAIVDRGVLDDVDYFIAAHIGFNHETNSVCPAARGFLSTTKIDVEYRGKGAHAGVSPNEGNNALLAAACAVMNIHSISPHSGGVTRVNVGVLNSGVGRNVVPPNSFMKIETRGENSELNSYVYEKTVKILQSAADMYGVECKVEKVGEAITVECNKELAGIIEEEIIKLGSFNVIRDMGLGGSEDATFMIERVHRHGGKGCYMLFGSKIAAGHHNERFDFDEKVLVNALIINMKILMRLAGI